MSECDQSPKNKRRDSPFPVFDADVDNLVVIEYQVHSKSVDKEIMEILHRYGIKKFKFGYHELLDIRDIVVYVPRQESDQKIHPILTMRDELSRLLKEYHYITEQMNLSELYNRIHESTSVSKRIKGKKIPFLPKIKIMTQDAYYESYGKHFK